MLRSQITCRRSPFVDCGPSTTQRTRASCRLTAHARIPWRADRCESQAPQTESVSVQAQARRVLLAGLAAVSLLAGGSPAALAVTAATVSPVEQVSAEEQAQFDAEDAASEKQQLEYLLQQRNTVMMAELRSQRNALKEQVVGVQDQLQKKITEERANAVGARKAGDKSRADVIEAEAMELEAKQLEVQKAAAKMETQLSRSELLEQIRTLGARKKVEALVF